MRWKPLSEHSEQRALVNWVKARAVTMPELWLLVAIPNGGKRDKITGALLKAEGAKAGFPDLALFVPRNGFGALLIEMKRPEVKSQYKELAQKKGKLSPEQKTWHELLRAQGYRVEVCCGWWQAVEVIENYLGNGKACG